MDENEDLIFYEVSRTRLLELLQAESFLNCLEDAGVDNWEGYSEAMENYDLEAAIDDLTFYKMV